MEAEFLNAYITKLRSTIDELTHRNIMLDTELLVTKNLCQSLQQQIDSLHEINQIQYTDSNESNNQVTYTDSNESDKQVTKKLKRESGF